MERKSCYNEPCDNQNKEKEGNIIPGMLWEPEFERLEKRNYVCGFTGDRCMFLNIYK